MRLALFLGALLPLVSSQAAQTVDPAFLEEVFGTPPPPTGAVSDRTPLEEIAVRPTSATATYVNEAGAACRCVPYYLCQEETNTTIDDPTVTGFGQLDIRFREDECQESTEKCCTDPVEAASRLPQRPDPSRLRGCGYSNPRGLDFTITGGTGTESQFGEFPWVVALLSAEATCLGAGVLVNPSVVLTGAHNVHKFLGTRIKVRAGEWDTQTVKERLPHQERDVDEIFVHPEFDPKRLYNDVALLRLAAPVDLADHINVACLPPQGTGFDGVKNCVANGWGKNVFGKPGRYAVILKKVFLDVVEQGTCQAQLQRTRLGQRFRLHRSFLCAGGKEGKDTCQGDGGAPLACPMGNDRYQVSGLVAWGIGCGQRDVPGVYARVANYRSWIDRKVEEWGFDTSSYVAG